MGPPEADASEATAGKRQKGACARADPTGPLVRWEQRAKAVSPLPSSGAHPRWRARVCRGKGPKRPGGSKARQRGASTVPADKTCRAHSVWVSSPGPGLPSCPSPPETRMLTHVWVCAHRTRARAHSSAILQLLQDATALTVTDDDVVDLTQTPVALWVRMGAVRCGPAGRRGSAWDPSLRPKPIAG